MSKKEVVQNLLAVISQRDSTNLRRSDVSTKRAGMDKKTAVVWHDSGYGWVWGTRFPDQRISSGASSAQSAVNEAIKFFCSPNAMNPPYGIDRVDEKTYLSIKVLYSH